MGFFGKVFALIGMATVAAGGYGYFKYGPMLKTFDEGYVATYKQFAGKMMETGDPGSAMVRSVQVKDGLSADDVKESLKSLAASKNFMFVGEAPFYKQVQAMTNKEYRHISFLSFCDAMVGKMMAEYNDAYTAFMPCRIAVVQDKNGKLWLHTMSLDLMIHGGKKLPDDLRKEAERVWTVIKEIQDGAAQGDI
ncbi:MAG: DUF302 domain-containing protein [Magnetococcales bacterium]|nr:DUF302 domain-containing protein [Magnetococcales bacterium]